MSATNFFQNNIAIIEQRWPRLASMLESTEVDFDRFELLEGSNLALVCDGMQINSSYDSSAEASLIAGQIGDSATTAHVYGVGSGQVIEQLLKTKDKVVVYLFNLSLFKVTLQVFNCQSWLAALNLNIELASDHKYVAKPFVAIPAELMVSDESAVALRDRVTLELDSHYVNAKNCMDNNELWQRIEPNLTLLDRDKDVSDFNFDTEKLCVVAGAGPTLSFHLDWLKQQQTQENILLIAVDAAVKPFYQAGIRPDLIVSIDRIGGDLFESVPQSFYQNTPMLYFPLLENSFLQTWPGERFASYSTGKSFDPLGKFCNKTRLYSGGSVIHPAIDFAVKKDAKSVLLLGADFSFINDQRHAQHTQQFSHFNPLAPKDCKHWVLNGFGEKNPTYLNFRGYLRDLEHYIELHPQVSFYNGSKIGANIAGAPIWPEFDDE